MARGLLLALGGNAILPAGKPGTIEDQRRITLDTMRSLASALAPEDRVVITHGNGPVIGNILIRNEAAADRVPPMPIDVCDADSQGGIGYMIAQCLDTVFAREGSKRHVTVIVTRVLVDPDDPAFQNPTKPIGPFFQEAEARRYEKSRGWIVREDSGRGWRRVVPSPTPWRILEVDAIRTLLDAGHLVVAAGGGGVPVAIRPDGEQVGVEAVVDKDRASALLASTLRLDSLVLVTAVTHVALRFGKPDQKNLDRMTLEEAKRYRDAGEFSVGSMLPKIESAIDFFADGGKDVLIASPENLSEALLGRSGTRIVP